MLCFLLTRHRVRGGNSTKCRWLEICSVTCCWSQWGNFLDGNWNPSTGWVSFYCGSCCCCVWDVVLVAHERLRHLQQAIYMVRSHHVSQWHVHMHTFFFLFSASLPLHKWKWYCGVIWLSGWSLAAALQQAPRVKYFHSFTAESGCLALICHAGLMWRWWQWLFLSLQCDFWGGRNHI